MEMRDDRKNDGTNVGGMGVLDVAGVFGPFERDGTGRCRP